MKNRLFWLLGCVVLLGLTTRPATPEEPKRNPKEEDVLLKNAEAFVEAFNKADAKALAAFFTINADVVTPEGDHLKGRKAIEESYGKLFAGAKGAKLLIRITSLR